MKNPVWESDVIQAALEREFADFGVAVGEVVPEERKKALLKIVQGAVEQVQGGFEVIIIGRAIVALAETYFEWVATLTDEEVARAITEWNER